MFVRRWRSSANLNPVRRWELHLYFRRPATSEAHRQRKERAQGCLQTSQDQASFPALRPASYVRNTGCGLWRSAGTREQSDDSAVRSTSCETETMAIEKFKGFRTDAIISAAAAQQSQGVATKVTPVGASELTHIICKSLEWRARGDSNSRPSA
jgi:hypothetical protein